MIKNRQLRKTKRAEANASMTGAELAAVIDELGKQSIHEKRQQKELKSHWQTRLDASQEQIQQFEQLENQLKQQRRERSAALQTQLFSNYQFLNQSGQRKSLIDIFSEQPNQIPPAGSGECAAPKLLQYAFTNQYRPICMAEFWWGCSPKSEIRQHKQFYPSCQSKCQPILGHMLSGLELDDNPLLMNPAANKDIDIVYQDDAIVVVNKPAEFLSVPGVHVKDSVATRLKAMFQDKEDVFVLHRLDMSTSGLLVFAFTRRANKHLQKQFITRQVSKRYIAIIDGEVALKLGTISLPIRGNPDDRPRQMVCYEHGKPAHTEWELLNIDEKGRSRIYLYPHTGRTHQLRVHCAHPNGLSMPIVGDDLYGTSAERLHLHAEQLAFTHPYTQEPMLFSAPAEF